MNILIVEDDPMVGQINSRFARKLSFVGQVQLAENLEEAKVLIEDNSFDLMLLDVYFPNGRGPDLLEWIRGRKIPLDVIFITADKSPQTVERALHLGAVDYLVKPFTFQRFKRALENALERIEGINRSEDFSQEKLDQVFSPGTEAETGEADGAENTQQAQSLDDQLLKPADLDKGMSYKTYEHVLGAVVKSNKSFTAEQLGRHLGIARVTIRRYLDYMEKKGILEVELQYGRIGRPQHFYRYRRGL